ncbi:MAG: bile acid:sodium symporter family protein [Kordiimonas sp.]
MQGVLSIALAFIMFAVALGLRPSDFTFVRTHTRSVIIGTVVQLAGLPVLTLGLISAIEPSPGIALGMLVVACCPGGNVSNLLTRISKGNAAYSVALTLISSIFAVALLPFAILFWTGLYSPTANLLEEINIDRVRFILATSVTLLIPLTAGLFTAHYRPQLAAKLGRIFMPIAIGILIILIVVGVSTNKHLILDYGTETLPLVIIHNALAFTLGALIGYAFLKDRLKARALTFEVGIQNTGLGLLIVLSQLGGIGSAAIIVASWSIWHLFAGFLLATLFRALNKSNEQQTAASIK